MRRIFCLFLIVAGCDSGNSNHNDDLSMPDLSGTESCTEGAKCALAGGGKGLCKSGVCAACVDPTDDTACDGAYSEPGKHYVCLAGACAIGCRTSNDCMGGICGLQTANVCSPCANDSQCVMALGNGFICNTTSGQCVTNECTVPNEACANPADRCCAGATNTCFAGDCCSNADCAGGGKSCVNHVCTTCPAPTNNTLFVDPSEGAGGAPTGADMPGCRYKTITAAMNAITGPGTIKVYGTKTITGTGTPCDDATVECFPIAVKAGVTVVGDMTMAPTINVAAGTNGFTLSSAGSGLSRLTLDGSDPSAMPAASVGIRVIPAATPSPTPAPALDHVTVKTFSSYGIQVSGGTLVINQGVVSTGNSNGLALVDDDACRVTINGGTDQISFSNNVADGIHVENGALTANGTAGVSGAGNLVCNENVNGINVFELPGTGAAKTVTLTGVVGWKNSASGVSITAGTPVKIRNSYFLANKKGIDIQANAAPTDLNLGIDPDWGHNTLQDSDAAKKNSSAGLCNGTSGNIQAQGNFFSGIDCSVMTPSGTPSFSATCTGGVDIGNPGSGTIFRTNCN